MLIESDTIKAFSSPENRTRVTNEKKMSGCNFVFVGRLSFPLAKQADHYNILINELH